MNEGLGQLTPSQLAESGPKIVAIKGTSSHLDRHLHRVVPLLRALRPSQWLKNGVVFAGLVFGGRLFESEAVLSALAAAILFCLLSSGFYLINDVRDVQADRHHPDKRLRPIAAGDLSPLAAVAAGVVLILIALIGSSLVSYAFLLVALAYAALMASYNLGLKLFVMVDVFVIAAGFVVRAVGGTVAVDVTISPWLLVCTLLLALLLGFGKRRSELMLLDNAENHRRNLGKYSRHLLDKSIAVTALGTLLAYMVYAGGSDSGPFQDRMIVTVPVVAYAMFRYLFLVYRRDQGGAPESMLISDRPLLLSVATWSLLSATLFYWER